MLYPQNALYTFIPKNGCSTLRLSLAMNNGVIKSPSDIDWIHRNNSTFRASLKDSVLSSYSFVVLRCPYRRLISVFLDKFVGGDPLVKNFLNIASEKLSADDITFSFFVGSLLSDGVLRSNIHWRNQSDFLVYDDYDDYFQLEQFKEAGQVLKEKIDFVVVDARKHTNHGVDGLVKDNSLASAYDMPIAKLKQLKEQGIVPATECFYNSELIERVKSIYSNDLKLYEEKFGASNLLFSSTV